jgi:hypothetical protein
MFIFEYLQQLDPRIFWNFRSGSHFFWPSQALYGNTAEVWVSGSTGSPFRLVDLISTWIDSRVTQSTRIALWPVQSLLKSVSFFPLVGNPVRRPITALQSAVLSWIRLHRQNGKHSASFPFWSFTPTQYCLLTAVLYSDSIDSFLRTPMANLEKHFGSAQVFDDPKMRFLLGCSFQTALDGRRLCGHWFLPFGETETISGFFSLRWRLVIQIYRNYESLKCSFLEIGWKCASDDGKRPEPLG